MSSANHQSKRQLLRTIMQVKAITSSQYLIEMKLQLDAAVQFALNPAWIAPHLKLVFPNAQGEIVFPAMTADQKIDRQSSLPIPVRTFSIADYAADLQQLTLIFARHQAGIAGSWAEQAQVGAKLGLLSLGGKLCYQNQFLVMLGDLSALPAIRYTLSRLPSDACGRVLLLVPDLAAKQSLDAPAGMQIDWLVAEQHNPAPLLAWLEQLSLPTETEVLIWGGLERQQAQAARQFIKQHFSQLSRQQTPILNYWQQGLAEGEFRHREDVEK